MDSNVQSVVKKNVIVSKIMTQQPEVAKEMRQKQVIHFPISTGTYSSFTNHIVKLASQKKSSMVCVANAHMFCEAHFDPQFLEIVENSDIITPDGTPLTWALKLLHGIKQVRVAGMDLLPDLLQEMSQQSISAYFYGGTQEMLNNTEIFLKNNFPELNVAGMHSPPFGNHQLQDDEEVIEKINGSSPAIVFVILGCPKQEKWMASMKGKINTVMIGIGGALPVMLGMKKRAPVWMQNNGLEWLFRLGQEPRRLFKRYFITNSLFLFIVFKEYIKKKLSQLIGYSNHRDVF